MKVIFENLSRIYLIYFIASSITIFPSTLHSKTRLIISNEKDSTLTILDDEGNITGSMPTCARPRGIMFGPQRKEFYVACADDNQIAI